jgi:hypothetical protein
VEPAGDVCWGLASAGLSPAKRIFHKNKNSART